MDAPVTASTRESILDAIARLLPRYGFRKTTVDDVAREARVSRRTIYMYFAGKEDLGLASIERVAARALARMAQALDGPGATTDRLRAALVARVFERAEAAREYEVSQDELFEAVRPEYLKRRTQHFERERALVTAALDEGVRAGELDIPNPQSVASSLLLATGALLPYSLSVAELGGLPAVRARLDAMLDLLVRGLLRVR